MTRKKKKNSSRPPMRPRASTIAEFPAPPPPGSRTPSLAPRAAAASTRDPLVVVEEAIGELELLDSAQAAASLCCGALRLALGARAVIVHATDSRARQIRVVAASGAASEALAGKTAPVDDDVIASTVIETAAPMTLAIDPAVGLPRRAPERLKTVGATRAVVAMPALVMNRVVAILEIVDAKAEAATEPAGEYAAAQLARFLESRKKR